MKNIKAINTTTLPASSKLSTSAAATSSTDKKLGVTAPTKVKVGIEQASDNNLSRNIMPNFNNNSTISAPVTKQPANPELAAGTTNSVNDSNSIEATTQSNIMQLMEANNITPPMANLFAMLVLMYAQEMKTENSVSQEESESQSQVGSLQLANLKLNSQSLASLVTNDQAYLVTDTQTLETDLTTLQSQFTAYMKNSLSTDLSLSVGMLAASGVAWNSSIKASGAGTDLASHTFQGRSQFFNSTNNVITQGINTGNSIMSNQFTLKNTIFSTNTGIANNQFTTYQAIAGQIQQSIAANVSVASDMISKFVDNVLNALISIAGNKSQQAQQFFSTLASVASQLR